MNFADISFRLIAPEIFLFLCSLIILFVGLKYKDTNTRTLGLLSIAGLIITLALTLNTENGTFFGQTFIVDDYARAFKLIFILSAALTLMGSIDYIAKKMVNQGEFFSLLLMCTTGMMFLASAGELISMYVALEMSTISLYVLAAYRKEDLKSSEAGLKYLILGAISSGILLYGLSLIYGLTGTTVMSEIGERLFLGPNTNLATFFAIIMFVAGFGFKLAAAPFHMWAPDVYEGAPTPVTAFLSVASKAAGLAAFVRLFFESILIAKSEWVIILEIVAILAMVIGNVVALLQKNIKRMLAYSSIAQVGYVLVALAAGIDLSVGSMMIFLLAYLFTNIGAFIIVIAFSNATGSDKIDDYSGLIKRSPFIAIVMTIFMLSLVGLPPTAGFFAKYWLFAAAIKEGLYGLVVVAVLTSVVSLFYYMNIVRVMMFHKPKDDTTISYSGLVKIGLGISVFVVLIMVVFPSVFYNWGLKAATIFRF
jgi:NADH-quinone oxidoreductase subunit N